jgi:serine/threonine-protein kinase HipA
MSVAEVKLWGRTIGAVAWDVDQQVAHFEYHPDFITSKIEVAPLMMPLSSQIYSFPGLAAQTFHGLPGLLADSLPDRFGNALIDAWLAKEGRMPESFNPVERLCYIGTRGMGALEFAPARGPLRRASREVNVDALVALASEILSHRSALQGSFSSPERARALQDILQVGSSPGGARAKAIIAWNPATNAVRSGQVRVGSGFSHWLLKFDGVSGNRDKELDDPKGYGLVEYAYYLMARAAGIEMSECRLLEENGRQHFMTKRFDRTDQGRKIHMQSLGALAHYDYNLAGAYAYEQALQVIRQLDLGMQGLEQQFRRTAFNIMARNQDDHVKNIAFLMDKAGRWTLSPAYDMTYSYNPQGQWTNVHQMSVNGKRDHFEKEDFLEMARTAAMHKGRVLDILQDVQAAVSKWPVFAQQAGVPKAWVKRIGAVHRRIV